MTAYSILFCPWTTSILNSPGATRQVQRPTQLHLLDISHATKHAYDQHDVWYCKFKVLNTAPLPPLFTRPTHEWIYIKIVSAKLPFTSRLGDSLLGTQPRCFRCMDKPNSHSKSPVLSAEIDILRFVSVVSPSASYVCLRAPWLQASPESLLSLAAARLMLVFRTTGCRDGPTT